MERKTKRIRLLSEDVSEMDDETFNINSLPIEILIQIFRNLNYQDLCRSGRVCKKWHEASRCPVFWKKVDIQFSLGKESIYKVAKKFIGVLPACVTHLKIDFKEGYSRNWKFDIIELLKELRTNCPNLEMLALHRAKLRDISPGFHLGVEYLGNIRVLVLHHCLLKDMRSIFKYNECNGASKIEVLDISRSNGRFFIGHISNLPHLKKLRIAGHAWDRLFTDAPSLVSHLEVIDVEGTVSDPETFINILAYGFNLVELYMCFTHMWDEHLIFDDSKNVLPCLKIICLRGCAVTNKGVSLLLKSCPSLQHVYVGDLNRDTSNDFAKCYSKKVQVIDGMKYCDHHAKVDYMCE